MDLEFSIEKNGKPIDIYAGIVPGDNITLVVQGDGLKYSTIKVEDPSNNLRLRSSRKGEEHRFQTKFPRTQSFGSWKVGLEGRTTDEEHLKKTYELSVKEQSDVLQSNEDDTSEQEDSPEDNISPSLDEITDSEKTEDQIDPSQDLEKQEEQEPDLRSEIVTEDKSDQDQENEMNTLLIESEKEQEVPVTEEPVDNKPNNVEESMETKKQRNIEELDSKETTDQAISEEVAKMEDENSSQMYAESIEEKTSDELSSEDEAVMISKSEKNKQEEEEKEAPSTDLKDNPTQEHNEINTSSASIETEDEIKNTNIEHKQKPSRNTDDTFIDQHQQFEDQNTENASITKEESLPYNSDSKDEDIVSPSFLDHEINEGSEPTNETNQSEIQNFRTDRRQSQLNEIDNLDDLKLISHVVLSEYEKKDLEIPLAEFDQIDSKYYSIFKENDILYISDLLQRKPHSVATELSIEVDDIVEWYSTMYNIYGDNQHKLRQEYRKLRAEYNEYQRELDQKMQSSSAQDPITVLVGVDQKYAHRLKQHDIHTVGDLLQVPLHRLISFYIDFDNPLLPKLWISNAKSHLGI